MFPSRGKPPPFSPVLLAGIMARPLPPVLLQPILDVAFAVLNKRHSEMFERLSGLENPVFLIDPVDLPLVFLLYATPDRPRLIAARKNDGQASATIRGPLLVLIDLLEGRLDGDALFFSRDLIIEGDTESVVALRNAIDNAEINLVEDVLSLLGPFSGAGRRAFNLGGKIFTRARNDLDLLRHSLQVPPPDGPRP